MNLLNNLIQNAIVEKSQTKFFVYYDEWNGNILNISTKLVDIDHAVLRTESLVARDILKGKISKKSFVVAEISGIHQLVSRNEIVAIRKQESVLTKIPKMGMSFSADINLILYKQDWMLEINLNQDTKLALLGKRHSVKIDKSKINDHDDLVLYCIERNRPFNLFEKIVVDPIDLVNNGYMLVDLSYLRNKVSIADLDFLTKRIFKNYNLKIKDKYVSVDYHSRKTHRRGYTTITTDEKQSTNFTISPSTNGWIIKSNFDDPHEHKIYRDIKIFLVDDGPFGLVDKIVLPYNKIGYFREIMVTTNVDPRDCFMIINAEHKNITFKYEEIKYAKSGKY